MQNRYRLFTTIISILFVHVIATINAQEKERSPIASGAGYPDGNFMQNLHGSPSTPPVLSEAKGLRGAGLRFTPNKGQLANRNGKLCPDILYKGDGGGAEIYLRTTGISYVYSNMAEVMHEVHEKVEVIEQSKEGFGNKTESEWEQELMQKESIKVHRVDMDFEGANKNIRTINENEVDGYNNYYYAHCPNGILNVKQYNKVTCKNIYDNIDVIYYGDGGSGVKYDIIVQPHTDPNQIKLCWKGSENIHINQEGHLLIKTSVNEFTESIPKVYQVINGKVIDIIAEYKLTISPSGTELAEGTKAREGIVTFQIGTWDREHALIIDPWISYYGGNGRDYSNSVNTDPTGNVAFTGSTNSINFPVSAGPFQSSLGAAGIFNAFVVKMNSAGIRLWATYYGGSTGGDAGCGIASDSNGNTLVSGYTATATFPVGAVLPNVVHQNIYAGGGFYGDAFLLKLDVNGARLWATYYGGSGNDMSSDVTVDGNNNAYLYGNTSSTTGISTPGAFQMAPNGIDAFIAKFASNGSRIWGTYIGGTGGGFGGDNSTGIACDLISGNIYITGFTSSANFPLVNPGSGAYFQGFGGGFNANAFISKFSPAGGLLWSTYYGATASGGDYAWGITVDFAGNVIISGYTYSGNFPIGSCCGNTVQQATGGGQKGFLVKFNNAGVRQWATFLGGNQPVQAYSTAVDANNNIYFAGEFEEYGPGNYPISPCAYQTNFGGGPPGYPEDQFIAKYNPSGKQTCITYLGGTGEDDLDHSQNRGGIIAIYGNALYLTGITTGGYPVTAGAFQTTYGGPPSSNVYSGGFDAFISQLCINICEAKVLGLSYTANATNICANVPVTFIPAVSNACDTTGYRFHWTFTGGNPASSDSVNPTVTFFGMGTHDVKVVVTTLCKKDSLTKTNYITVNPCATCNLNAQFTKGTANCTDCGCKEWIMVTATGGTSPYSYSWSASGGIVNRYRNQLCPGAYTINVKDKNGCSINVNLTAP